jgi:uncharacterized membrane protein
MEALVVLSRWLHVISAVLAVGGAFFLRVVVPAGLAEADAASRDSVLRSLRRKFKVVVHAAATLLILTGAFNTWRNWEDYKLRTGILHGLWGTHMLLGLVAIGMSISLLAKPEPPPNHRRLLTINLVLMFLLIGVASTLKFVRDQAVKTNGPTKSVRVDR